MSFWDTQVMAASVIAAEQHIGPMGRYQQDISDNRFYSVGLYTHSAGKFWYGDLDMPSEAKGLGKLADELGETVYVLPDLVTTDSSRILPLHKMSICSAPPSQG